MFTGISLLTGLDKVIQSLQLLDNIKQYNINIAISDSRHQKQVQSVL